MCRLLGKSISGTYRHDTIRQFHQFRVAAIAAQLSAKVKAQNPVQLAGLANILDPTSPHQRKASPRMLSEDVQNECLVFVYQSFFRKHSLINSTSSTPITTEIQTLLAAGLDRFDNAIHSEAMVKSDFNGHGPSLPEVSLRMMSSTLVSANSTSLPPLSAMGTGMGTGPVLYSQ